MDSSGGKDIRQHKANSLTWALNKLAKATSFILTKSKFICICLIFGLSILNTGFVFAEGFKWIDISSHRVPLPDSDFGGVSLPGTMIKAGIYQYEAGMDELLKLGFLIDSKKFYYVDSEYTLGDVHYGVVGNYFVLDGWGWGAAHNRVMFLCQFNKTSVKLLDVISEIADKDIGMMDFSSVVDETRTTQIIHPPPFPWMKIQVLDQDKIPEIKLKIEDYDFFLFMEIVDGHFRINFNPDLYAPLFEKENKKYSVSKNKSSAYYFYGFLSKKLDLKTIKLELKNSRGIVSLLEHIDKWNELFHNLSGVHFVMKQIDIEEK